MQAVILAAGMGKRLKKLTEDNTKCMIKVNGQTLIQRTLNKLEKLNLKKIVIVVGYKKENLKKHVQSLRIKTPIEYVENINYDSTNNIYSLFLAKDFLLQDDTLLFESDIIFEESMIDELINDSRDTLALVDKYESWMDGTCITLGEEDEIIDFIPKHKFNFDDTEKYYKTVNIYKFSKLFSQNYYVPFLEAYCKALGKNEYYEQVLNVIALVSKSVMKGKKVEEHCWYEIDDVQDLDIAQILFSENECNKLELIQKRYGGYWRFPKMIDFCYLVNPYFPPQKMIREIKTNFETLIRQYPSGMEVNTLLVSRNFGIDEKSILVGNGAAELIKGLMERLEGKCGLVSPSFAEYRNRCLKSMQIVFQPGNKSFAYTADDLILYFADKDIKNLVLVNPDNPSGNYIEKEDVIRLIDWTREQNIRFILDESFIDFAEEECSVLEQNILDKNKHLVVIKSISKSFGVPGVRLGILASSDFSLIEKLKKDVAIWNINSFAEFYLQIEQKYRSDYVEALNKIREERKRFIKELSTIDGIYVIPSQANYVMIRIEIGLSSQELSKNLLLKYNCLVKDLSEKICGQSYIRVAIRDSVDNERLINALKKEVENANNAG